MKEFLIAVVILVAFYLLGFKLPPARLKYDAFYNGWYIASPGILGKEVYTDSKGGFYTVKGPFGEDAIHTKEEAERLLIEYKRWLKSGH